MGDASSKSLSGKGYLSPIEPVAESVDTVTFRRSDFESLVRDLEEVKKVLMLLAELTKREL